MAIDEASAVVDIPYRRLSRKTLWVFILDRIAPSMVFLVVAAGLFGLNQANLLAKTPLGDLAIYGLWAAMIASGIFLITFLIAIFVSWLIYINYQYALQDDALKIRRGVFNREEIAIPYRQIQDVDIEQDITDRMLGVCRLVILTAGHEDEQKPEGESEGTLPVIDRELAEELQAELLRKTDVQRVREVE
ncbi:MAG: PH domain-containing protein [Patescibacteria group bacterium]|nr:PH domain-containing protein [Patescibacteria group bacterium]